MRKKLVTLVLAGVLMFSFVAWVIHNKDLRYGTIYSYNGFEEETHLLRFKAGYPEISPDDLIFEEWFETRYGEMINQSKFIEIWDTKSDDVGILALPENLDFELTEARYVALVSAEKVAIVQTTFVFTSTGEFADRHCIWVNRIEDLHVADWWE